ncbi:hypothetical protein D5S17_07020 [Pseudonocardiaceae bacterium YIM PH 21723]|nr:hypothetical protein D5S17_07020 [Pseudonocardiaceae bacterium YIM PH 21723]
MPTTHSCALGCGTRRRSCCATGDRGGPAVLGPGGDGRLRPARGAGGGRGDRSGPGLRPPDLRPGTGRRPGARRAASGHRALGDLPRR